MASQTLTLSRQNSRSSLLEDEDSRDLGCSPFTLLSSNTLAPSTSRDDLDEMLASYKERSPHKISNFFPRDRSGSDAPLPVTPQRIAGERRAKIKASVLKTSKAISCKVERAMERARARAKHVSEKLARPENVVARDKLGFSLGLVLVIFTEYIFLQQLPWVKTFYSSLVIPLYIARYFLYHAENTHYFLIDFCYVVNLLLLFNLHYYPNSRVLFKVAFALANGPVPIAIIAWRNSLVFHSLDKVTSVVIHLLPCFVTFCMRWYPEETTAGELIPPSSAGLVDLVVNPFCVYMYWQVAYFLKTQVVDRKYFEEKPQAWTSARWISRHRTSRGLANKLINKSGTEELSINISLVKIQVLYTVLTLAFIPILYHSYVCHGLYLIVIVFSCIHNGAGYYFEVFSKKYIEDVMMKAHHEEAKVKQDKQSGGQQSGRHSPPRAAKMDDIRGSLDRLDIHHDSDTSDDLHVEMLDPARCEGSEALR